MSSPSFLNLTTIECEYLIALGSNLGSTIGSRQTHLQHAIDLMKSRGFILVKTATPIETAPVGGVATEMFLNSAVIILARIEPAEMMRELLAIEHQMGRSRQEAQISPGANRIIDLDILMVKILGGQRDIMLMVDQPDLQIPHARMIDRGFVLQPAAEIAPDWVHPRSGRRIADLWKQLKV